MYMYLYDLRYFFLYICWIVWMRKIGIIIIIIIIFSGYKTRGLGHFQDNFSFLLAQNSLLPCQCLPSSSFWVTGFIIHHFVHYHSSHPHRKSWFSFCSCCSILLGEHQYLQLLSSRFIADVGSCWCPARCCYFLCFSSSFLVIFGSVLLPCFQVSVPFS